MAIEICFSTSGGDWYLDRACIEQGVIECVNDELETIVHALDPPSLRSLDCIDIVAQVNQKISKKRYADTDWKRNREWSRRGREMYAYVTANVSSWARSRRVPRSEWRDVQELVPEYVRIGRLVLAQVILLLEEDRESAEKLIEGTGVTLAEVVKAAGRKMRRPTYHLPLDVQVVLSKSDGRGNLALRAEMGAAMEEALRGEKLGVYDGGSSGEAHFEYGYLVSDLDRAIDSLRAALQSFEYDRVDFFRDQ